MSKPVCSADSPPHSHGCLADEFLRRLHELQSTGTLCDVVLKGSEETALGIPCHRNVLTVHSGYFRSLFTHDWKESSQRDLQLKSIDSRTLNELVQFAYTLDLRISEENMESLLVAAQFLQMDAVAGICWEYVEQKLSLSTCLAVHALAAQHHHPRLLDAALLTALIGSDDVGVYCEDEVWEAVRRWLDYDRPRRLLHVSAVLQTVRADCSTRRPWPVRRRGYGNYDSCFVGAQEVLVCVENWEDNWEASAVQVFSPSIPAVWRLTDQPPLGEYPNVAMLDDGRMMLISIQGVEAVQRDHSYTRLSGPPMALAAMQTVRSSEAAAVLDGRVFVAGGYGQMPVPVPVLSSVEAYVPKSNSWSAVAPLPVGLMNLVMVAYGGLLYAFGGETEDGHVSNGAFAYDPAANAWSRLHDYAQRPLQLRCVCGARRTDLRSGYEYDCVGMSAMDKSAYSIVIGKWPGDLVHPRNEPACACLQGKLYVLGGNASWDRRIRDADDASIEVYDPDADRWQLHECRLSEDIVGGSSVKMKLKRA
ncbi:kelch-like protein diablo [Paramacrobiotus metropolitanus]|uniref:kelch-like protein diablo n=1 Tax=Paramacrobiotus metropolitanus TaxID=2943436 RepID=UPI0024459A89|nr:kelch-like protein diablo [Paramacrobiotus metropolitanus]